MSDTTCVCTYYTKECGSNRTLPPVTYGLTPCWIVCICHLSLCSRPVDVSFNRASCPSHQHIHSLLECSHYISDSRYETTVTKRWSLCFFFPISIIEYYITIIISIKCHYAHHIKQCSETLIFSSVDTLLGDFFTNNDKKFKPTSWMLHKWICTRKNTQIERQT